MLNADNERQEMGEVIGDGFCEVVVCVQVGLERDRQHFVTFSRARRVTHEKLGGVEGQ